MAPNQVESLAPKWDDNVTNADKVRPEPDGVPEGLIRVENKLYSSKELAKLHPGGPLWIKVCTSHRLKNLTVRMCRAGYCGMKRYPGLGNIS